MKTWKIAALVGGAGLAGFFYGKQVEYNLMIDARARNNQMIAESQEQQQRIGPYAAGAYQCGDGRSYRGNGTELCPDGLPPHPVTF